MKEDEINRAMSRRIKVEWAYTVIPFVVLAGLLFFVWWTT